MDRTINCKHCGVEHTYEVLNFGRGASSKRVYCGSKCRQKAHYVRNSLKINTKSAEWRNNNPERERVHKLKSKCKRLGIRFDITEEDLCIPDVCPVLGFKMINLPYSTGRHQGYSPYAPSVDRMDPNLGYVRGNVRVISSRANLLKSDATVEELELVLADLKELRKE